MTRVMCSSVDAFSNTLSACASHYLTDVHMTTVPRGLFEASLYISLVGVEPNVQMSPEAHMGSAGFGPPRPGLVLHED